TPCPAPGATSEAGASVATDVAAITSPSSGEPVGASVTVRGSAAGQYDLMYGVGAAPENWTVIVSGMGEVSNGLLGVWDTGRLGAGDYTLRLAVSLPGSPTQEARVRVAIDNGALGVRLLQPAPGTVVRQGNQLSLEAEASGPAVHLEWLVDDQVVGGRDGTSGAMNWTAAGPGRHTIVAVAVDDSGRRARSQPIVVRVE
ncbi:MAG TPA: Ig-like domain-containing protein, partial [Herpetosiphonaceae bacterium]|nr:Ig-like domain-containing protein [Herpetosiphonaceae bacterium]